MSCPLKSVMMDYIAFRYPSSKGDPRFATKTLVRVAQSVMSGYTKAEILCAGTCTTIPQILELQMG